jgi:hypothetical protein
MSYAVSVLLYGLFLAIFVALYLTKKKESDPAPDDSEQQTIDN